MTALWPGEAARRQLVAEASRGLAVHEQTERSGRGLRGRTAGRAQWVAGFGRAAGGPDRTAAVAAVGILEAASRRTPAAAKCFAVDSAGGSAVASGASTRT